ncbi:MAG: sugar-binding domain-containing protein [Ferruginibacter sp.]
MKHLFTPFFLLTSLFAFTQVDSVKFDHDWKFRQAGKLNWSNANVPGTIHTDLLQNKLIPDPFFMDNEKKVQWVDSVGWEYIKQFDLNEKIFESNNIELLFEGLDTYADVYLNGKLILQANNMFRGWKVDIRPFLKKKRNTLFINFFSAQARVDSIAKAQLPLMLPDNNRVYARKAQFQFGWDWGPKLIGCGIWKNIFLIYGQIKPDVNKVAFNNKVKLIQQKDSSGISFYFEKDGVPVFIKGANWIPADIFLPRVKKEDYRVLLQMAKDANMNMLRVWGGGIYEDDAFYDICDEMGIMVWQDFMFAGGMYPGDKDFFKNVKEEVKYQVTRLRHHPSIVLWCGNNEIDEAWHNWGWQKQYNLHAEDSAKIWKDYTRLFRDSLRQWVTELDNRPYISTSPKYGWGNEKSYQEGDSHYWGLWWGLEDWEKFNTRTGRFVSEFGMQAMPDYHTIKKYTSPEARMIRSAGIQWHQ